jgi:hypothetical protein
LSIILCDNVLYDTSGRGGVKEAVHDFCGNVNASYPQAQVRSTQELIGASEKVAGAIADASTEGGKLQSRIVGLTWALVFVGIVQAVTAVVEVLHHP